MTMRLIDADALKAKLREGLEHYQYRPDDFAIGKVSGLVDAMEEVDRAPTIDAIPVEWLKAQIFPFRDKLKDEAKGVFNATVREIIYRWQKEQEAR